MKIESKGVEITEIPVFSRIIVTEDEIALDGGEGDFTYLTRKEVLALRDALNAALDAQIKMPGAEMVTDALGDRVFAENDPEPGPEITKLIDRDDDIWRRVHGGWCVDSNYEVEPWSYVLNFVPLTEVR